jgi:hypothetical protein
MALLNIKEIINNRGYVINPDDRKIFEEGDLQSFFGFSENDAIEFIVYDVNNNQLPQADGNLVRYIQLTTENINDYFLVPNGTSFQKYQLPKEYFIDIERLLGEAGYSNGIFRTQVTLINKRAGSDKQYDKLWIQEISPSRTEVRLFPLKEGVELNSELKTRYDAFVNDREFREDTISYVFEFIEKVKPSEISTFLKSKYSSSWLDNLVNEFKIQSFDLFINTIYEKFVQSCLYEFTNRVSVLTDLNYGKPKSTKPQVILSKELVVSICKKILVETINYYLPRQDNKTQTVTIGDFLSSVDEVGEILQTQTSDTIFNTKPFTVVYTQATGSAATESEITLNTSVSKATDGQTTTTTTADGEEKYNPADETTTTTTGGGASGQTILTGAGKSEDTRGQTGQFNPGLAEGARPTGGAQQ